MLKVISCWGVSYEAWAAAAECYYSKHPKERCLLIFSSEMTNVLPLNSNLNTAATSEGKITLWNGNFSMSCGVVLSCPDD